MKAVGYVTRLEGHSIRRQQDGIRSCFAATYRINWHSDYGLKDESVRPELVELVAQADGTQYFGAPDLNPNHARPLAMPKVPFRALGTASGILSCSHTPL